MGGDDKECTLKCVAKGATFGFVDAERKHFYQLDDQETGEAAARAKRCGSWGGSRATRSS